MKCSVVNKFGSEVEKEDCKELNEDIIQFENKFEKLDNLINVLYAKVAALEKKDEDRPSNPDITSRQPNKRMKTFPESILVKSVTLISKVKRP